MTVRLTRSSGATADSEGGTHELGYHRPLYLLPFDRRHSYVTGMFDFQPPLTADQHTAVTDSKQVFYEGFRQTPGNGVPTTCAPIPVVGEFGAGKASAMQAPSSDDEVQ